MTRIFMIAFAAGLALLATAAPAQDGKKVYRCETLGRVVYTDEPCEGAREVQVDDKRSAADRQAAASRVQRESQRTDMLARERRAQEAAAARQRPAVIPHSAAQAAAAASAPAKKPPVKKKENAAQPSRQPSPQP